MPKCYKPRNIDLRLMPQQDEPGLLNASALTVRDETGTVLVTNVREIRVTDGTLTDNEDGSVSIAIGAGGGGHHMAHFMLPLPALSFPPGPYNLTLAADGTTIIPLTFKMIRIEADGAIAGSIAGHGFTFGEGGGFEGPVAISGTWTAGAALPYSITEGSQGLYGTYLIADVVAWE